MKRRFFICLLISAFGCAAQAAILTVTTADNANVTANQLSLAQALAQAKDGDEIRFNLVPPGVHYIETPADGYPLVTNQNITINGYSQPGSSPNANPILAANNAKIGIVLDSRSGGHRSMQLTATAPADDPGFDSTRGAILAADGARNLRIFGLGFLGVPQVGVNQEKTLTFIALARGSAAQVSGCWLGVDPDGKTVAAASEGITGLHYTAKDESGIVLTNYLADGAVIGVGAGATNAVQQFNVIAGMPAVPIRLEGNGARISGNFIMVLPDGLHDYDVALNPDLSGRFGGAIEIGQGGNNTLIGTDGDGLNDENERNVFGGMLPTAMGGYDHLIEFYSQSPGTNIVIAGNYVGVGVDGTTRFTNGVPFLNGSGAAAQYRVGSNLDNLSDKFEGNLIANNYPPDLFPAASFRQAPDTLNFLSQLSVTGAVLFRGNSLINNFPFPASPLRGGGTFLSDYYSQALVDSTQGVNPILSTNSTVSHLKGTLPAVNLDVYPATSIDVYVADPVGLTNGAAAGIPELPQGFVQGLTYLGSFVENAAADLDPQRGSFDFDISKLKLPAGTPITVTANYLAPEGFSLPSTLDQITKTADGVVVTWTGDGTLQSAPELTGPWTDESTTGNSFEVPATDAAQFFRLQSSGSTGGSGAPPLTSPFSNVVRLQ